MPTLALLGDSILDNKPYVGSEPDTAGHLRHLLGDDWIVELLAQDGSTIDEVKAQLGRMPDSTDIAVLSAGGNDAVEHIGLLVQPATSTAAVLGQLHEIADQFANRYQRLLGQVRPRVQRVIACTIYEPPLSDAGAARLATVPLALLNDRIVRVAAQNGADVLELRLVCNDAADFVMEIEPSAIGAAKIAGAIARCVRAANGASSRVFAT